MCSFTMCVFACLYAPQTLCYQGTICKSWFIFSTRWLQGIKVRSLGLVASTCILWAISLPLFAVFWSKSNPRILDCVTQDHICSSGKGEVEMSSFSLNVRLSTYILRFLDNIWCNPLLWNLSIIPKVFRWSCFCIIYYTISCYFVLPSFLNVKYTV